jgi:hypothetical protein
MGSHPSSPCYLSIIFLCFNGWVHTNRFTLLHYYLWFCGLTHTHSPCAIFFNCLLFSHTPFWGSRDAFWPFSSVQVHTQAHTHMCTLGYSFCWPPILTFSWDPLWHLLQCKGLLVQHEGLMLVQESPSTQCRVVATQALRSPSI